MFCSKCGKEIMDEAVICPHCGYATKAWGIPVEGQKTNIFACIGFVFSLFFAIFEVSISIRWVTMIWILAMGFILVFPSLVFSIIGYKKAPEYNNSDKGLALSGIIISSIGIVLIILEIIGFVTA